MYPVESRLQQYGIVPPLHRQNQPVSHIERSKAIVQQIMAESEANKEAMRLGMLGQPAAAYNRVPGELSEGVEREGPIKQFMHGLASPVTDTAARLGWMDKRPKPQTTGETVSHAVGGILGWIGVGAIAAAAGAALAPALGLGATVAVGASGMAVPTLSAAALVAPVAGLAESAVAAKAITAIGSAAITGAMYGAHSAWVDEEPIAPGALKGMAFGAVMGGVGAGVGRAMEKAGKMKITSSTILDDFFKKKPILDTRDMITMRQAGKLGDLLGKIPSRRLAPAVEESMERVLRAANPAVSQPSQKDIGLMFGSSFNTLSPKKQAELLVEAAAGHPEVDTLLQPVLEISRSVTTPDTLFRGKVINETHGYARDIINASAPASIELDPFFTKAMAPSQRKLLVEAAEASNLGDQFKIIKRLTKNLKQAQRRLLRSNQVEHFSDLVRNAGVDVKAQRSVDTFVAREAAIQDLTWQLGNQISKTAHRHPSINLPDITSIHDSAAGMVYLDKMKREGGEGVILSWHPKLEAFLKDINKDTGKSYTTTTALPKRYRAEWNKIVKEIKDSGGSIKQMHHGLMTFPVPEDVYKKNIPDFIKNMTELPAGATYNPINIHDSIVLKTELLKPAPWLGRLLTPVRLALGEPFANQARVRVQKHQKFVDAGRVKIKEWLEYLGVKPGKEAVEAGVKIRNILEGIVPEPLRARFDGAASLLVKHNKKPTQQDLHRIASSFGLKEKDLAEVWGKVSIIMGDKAKAEAFQKYAEATGMTIEKYAAQHLLNKGLLRAENASGKGLETLAKSFGCSAKELKVAVKMRKEFDRLFKLADLDVDLYLPGYLPRFRKMEGKSYQEMVDIFAGHKIPESEIKGYLWMNELSRHAKDTAYTYEQDAFRAYSRYLSGLSKNIHFGDDFWESYVKHFKDLGMSRSRMEVLRDLRHWMIGKPGEAEQQMDSMINSLVGSINKSPWRESWGSRPSAELSALLAELQYSGGIGYNPFTAIKNLTQKALALTSITDDGNALHGLKWMAKAKILKLKPEGEFYLSDCRILKSRSFTEGLEAQYSAMERMAQRLFQSDKAAKATRRIQDKSMAMFQWSDRSNVEDTWLARFLYLTEAKGAPIADACNLATRTTMATQFMYGFDSPMLYKTPLGRQAGIFMSWPINWAFLLYEQGTSGDVRKAISTVVTMALGAEILTMTGLNFMSIHPVNTARGILPIAMMSDEDRWPLVARSAASINSYIRAMVDGDDEAVDSALDSLRNRLRPLVPLGVVTFRMLDFIELVKNDWRKYDNRGRLKYEVKPGEAVRGLIGPTTEAYNRVEDWQRVTRMEGYYRHTRAQAIEAFMNQDYNRFQKLQEQLVVNFGKWIEPKDIRYEVQLRNMTARERQLISLPEELREPYLAKYGK